MKRVKEVAELTGVSVRTLHYYDEIGLLTPATTEAGYRLYSKDDLEKLQQILFFRALDFSLKKIKTILEEPDFDRMEALNYQKEILHEKKQRLDKMITMIDKTIQNVKGERSMTDQERFAGFDLARTHMNKRHASVMEMKPSIILSKRSTAYQRAKKMRSVTHLIPFIKDWLILERVHRKQMKRRKRFTIGMNFSMEISDTIIRLKRLKDLVKCM